MATFRLVASGDLDTTQAHFAFQVSDGNTYLQFGLLSADNRRHFASVVAGGRVGFFESGRELSDSEAPNARILADYDATNGVAVDDIPAALEIGSDYEIKWTQARPGAPSEGSDSVPLDVTLLEGVPIERLVETTLMYTYQIGENAPSGRQWVVKWYASVSAYEAGTPEMPVADAPLNVSIHPRVLSDRIGEHIFFLTFTPRRSGAHYIGFDVSAEASDPARPSEGVILLDAEGFALVDSVGFYLTQEVEEQWTFLVDADGDQLVDADGNRLVEVS